MAKLSSVRIYTLFLIFLIIYGAITVHLYRLQICNQSQYKMLGDKQYANVICSKPPRAEILDRNGVQIATNIYKMSAFITPSNIYKPDELKIFLKKHFPDALTRLESNVSHFMYVKRHLSPAEVELINKSKVTDIYVLKELARYYPSESLGPVVGITDIDNKGLSGLEAMYDHLLAGSESYVVLEKDARSGHYYFNKEIKQDGTQGKPIKTTIDSALQFIAYDELKDAVNRVKAKEGAVIIVEPTTGDILVMAQYPNFNPNEHATIDLEKTKNKIVTETYELGSVMKVFLALSVLDDGVVKPDELIDCQNTKTAFINGMRVNTYRPHGMLTFSEVIEKSNNIGTSKVALRLGTKLYDYYNRCGFGQKTGLNFPGEQKGFVNPPRLWSKLSPFSLSFGYESRLSLLQFAKAFGLIATDGSLITPRLLADEKISSAGRIFTHQTIEVLRSILKNTVDQGTARRAKIDGYDVFGKTGTAYLAIDGHYDKTRQVYTFAGLIEKGNYKREIVTFIKETANPADMSFNTVVPLFNNIARKMLVHDRII